MTLTKTAPDFRYATGEWSVKALGFYPREAVMVHGEHDDVEAKRRAAEVFAFEYGVADEHLTPDRLHVEPARRWRNNPCPPNVCGEHGFHWQAVDGGRGSYPARMVVIAWAATR